MGNLLRNAGYLEGTAGWTATAQLTLAVDDATRGGPGRHVLVGSGTTTAVNQVQAVRTLAADRPVVTAGQVVEAYAGLHASPTASLAIEWYNAGGSLISATALTQRPALLTQHGSGIRGLGETFARGYGRATAPAGTARAGLVLSVQPAASGTAVTLALLKPFLGLVPALTGEPSLWDPGTHQEAGLDLPAWPSLRPFQAGPLVQPTPARTEFSSAEGLAVTRRISTLPRKRFQGRTRCDAVQRALLEDFFAEAHPAFWFVDPETEQLCVARWAAGGEPRAAEVRGVTTLMEVGLNLEIA